MTPNDKNQDKNNPEAPLKHRWGIRFKTAREAMNLTEKDAALRLHLKPHLIEIIETERFENGPPAIFMRGYIRSYGRLLNIPEKEIAHALTQLNLDNPAAVPPSPVMRSHMQANQNNHSGWSTALVVVVLVGLVGMWWNNHTRHAVKEPDAMTAMQQQSAQPQPMVSVASNPAPEVPAANPTVPQTPADPMPKELAAKMPAATTATPASAPAPTAANVASAQPEATPATTNNTVATADPTPNKPATDNNKDVTADANHMDAAAIDKPAQTADNDDSADKAEKSATRIARTHNEVTSDDMEVPEQGLDTDDNNNS